MRKFKIISVLVATLSLLAVWQVVASAHTNTDQDADCTNVYAEFWGFDAGVTAITFNSGEGSVTKRTGHLPEDVTFNLQAAWSEMGVDTSEGGNHDWWLTWTTVHGGNPNPQTFTFNADHCVPVATTTTTTVPPTTTTTRPHTPPTTVPPLAPPAPPVVTPPDYAG